MSLRFSFATVAIASFLAVGCAQDSLTSPSSSSVLSAGTGPARTQSGVSPVFAQLIVVDNQLVSANHQLTLFLIPPNPIDPPDPIIPPNPISPPWDQNALDFYIKANDILASIPPNPIAPPTDLLTDIVAQADITLNLIATTVIPPNPIIPQIITQAQRTKTLVAAILNCGDVCSTP